MSKEKDELQKLHDIEDQKDYEMRVKRRVLMLLDDVKAGKMRVAPHLVEDLNTKLSYIKFDKAGDPIVDSVDPVIRAVAMGSEFQFMNSESSKVSPAYIQTEMFGLIEDVAAPLLSLPDADEQPAWVIAEALCEDESFVKHNLTIVEGLAETVRDFWESFGWVVHHQLNSSKYSKALFVGDMFPADPVATCCKTALFFDQILLPDPFSRVLYEAGPVIGSKQSLSKIIKHCINAYRMKSLVFAECEMSPVLLVPGSLLISGENTDSRYVKRATLDDSVDHINRSFGSDFSSTDEFVKWVSKYDIDSVARAMQYPELLLATDDGENNPSKALKDQVKFFHDHNYDIGKISLGELIVMTVFGRYGQVNDALSRSMNYSAEPIYDVAASHQWLKWKLDLDEARSRFGDSVDWKSDAASQLAGSANIESEYLSGITPQGLIKARQSGALDSLRKEVGDLIESYKDSGDPYSASKIAVEALGIKAKEYNVRMNELMREEDGLAKGLGWTIVSGTLAICAASAANPYLAALVAGAGILGQGKGLVPGWIEAKQLLKEKSQLRNTPIGMLFQD